MSIKLHDIIEYMEKTAPAATALSWDNVGLQVGSKKQEIRKVLLALDVSPDVIKEAKAMKADLIMTHHPLIFRPLSRFDFTTPAGEIIRDLVLENISLYSAHTNLDRSIEGTGRSLADLLDLKDVKPYTEDPEDEMNMIITGSFPTPLNEDEIISLFREKLEAKAVSFTGKREKVKTVAILPGSGGSFIDKLRGPIDLIITGESGYHNALSALYKGIYMATIGHYASEKPAMFRLMALLKEEFDELEIKVSDMEAEPYRSVTLD